MSFTIKLQYSNSPKEMLTKTVTDEYTFTGTLKDGTSLVDPVVLVESSTEPVNVNYAEISAFNRKYFIVNITSVRNNLWEIALHVDVLSTYAVQIRQQVGIIAKNEKSFNLYLNDSRFRCYQNPHVIVKQFPNAFDPANFRFVLALAAAQSDVRLIPI